VRLRSALAYITGQFPDQVRVLREDATLERVALLTAHGAYVQRICGLFVRRLLEHATSRTRNPGRSAASSTTRSPHGPKTAGTNSR
jgi:hypothetical protein